MDVIFYTLDFSQRIILPASSKDRGYVSMTGVTDFRGKGSFQLSFCDNEIKSFVKAHPEGYFVKWGQFEGYASDFQFKDTAKKSFVLFGSHLNCLLNRVLFPPQTITKESVNDVMIELINEHAPWLIYDTFEDEISGEFITDKYMEADKFIEEYFASLKLGYNVYIKDRELHFRIVPSNVNPLILSKGNRNIYETQEDFSNKKTAFGGWYKKTEEDNGKELETAKWTYITSAEKEGIYKRDILLSASSPSAAKQELAEHKDTYTTVCKTRNVSYGTDYKLGDVIRLQIDDKAIKKQVTSVDMWFEGASYREEPTLTDWEE